MLDVTHLLVAYALQENAFEVKYQTAEDVLHKPLLDTGRTNLAWREELRNQRICQMSVDTFREHFKRLCLVAGLQSPPRPYFFRVGAGANFEGAWSLPEIGLLLDLVAERLDDLSDMHMLTLAPCNVPQIAGCR